MYGASYSHIQYTLLYYKLQALSQHLSIMDRLHVVILSRLACRLVETQLLQHKPHYQVPMDARTQVLGSR